MQRQYIRDITALVSVEYQKAGFIDWVEKQMVDSYGSIIADFAYNWAKLMQLRMGMGIPFNSVVKPSADELKYIGYSAKQYCEAVKILCKFWKYGDELREFHEITYGKSFYWTYNVSNEKLLTSA